MFGINPRLADTDGDSFTEGAGTVLFDPDNSPTLFDPPVVDIARIAIDLASVLQVELDFTESDGTARTVATRHDRGTSSGVPRGRGGWSTRQLQIGHTLSVSRSDTAGVEVSASPTDVGASASHERSLRVGLSASRTQTRGSSVDWNETRQRENSETFGESGNLEYADGGFPTTSITTNSESAPLNFSADLSLPQARRLLRDSTDLVVLPSTFRPLDRDSRSVLLRDQDVSARTATVIVDFGVDSDRLETHRVAVDRGGGSRSISAPRALHDVLGPDVEQGSGQRAYGDEGSARATRAFVG